MNLNVLVLYTEYLKLEKKNSEVNKYLQLLTFELAGTIRLHLLDRTKLIQ